MLQILFFPCFILQKFKLLKYSNSVIAKSKLNQYKLFPKPDHGIHLLGVQR